MDIEVTQDDLNEVEEICYNDGYEIDDIQDAMETLSDELKTEMTKDYEPDVMAGVKFIEHQINYKRENYEYDIEKEIEPIDTGMPEDCSFYEAKQYLNSRGYILVEAKAKDDSLYAKAKDRIKKEKQKYVPQLKEVNGKIDAKSFQDYLSKVLKRKINFHTSPKGELFWDITSQEQNKLPVRIPLLAYRIDYHLFGRKDDKWRIVINNKYNQQVFDTSCWSDNIRAYRAEVSAEADPMMVELANKIMRAYNKVPKYVQAGKIFKSRIMQVEPDGDWHTIGSTLDIDAIEEMGYNLKKEMYGDVTVEKNSKGIYPNVNIKFEYNYSLVEIQAMVAPMYCKCQMKVTKK